MHRYRVVEMCSETGLCWFRCSSGRFHVARALDSMPPEKALLHGFKPGFGLRILVCPSSGAVFRMIF